MWRTTDYLKGIIIFIVSLIVLVGGAIFIFHTNTSDEVVKVGTNYRDVSPDVREINKEVRETFWEEGDYEGTYQLLKKQAESIVSENRQKTSLTAIELNDEMQVMSNYAAITRIIYPEEGIKIYAEIYNNVLYTGQVRADALFHAMFYLAEKYNAELKLENVNNWIFAENLFGSVLKGSDLEGKKLANDKEVLTAAILGLTQAEQIAGSRKTRMRILALKYDLEVRVMTDEFINSYQKTNEDPAMLIERANLDLDQTIWNRLNELVSQDYPELEQLIIEAFNDTEEWPAFNLEFVHAAKNILRSYTTLQSLGYDVSGRFDVIYNETVKYMNYHLSNSDPADTNKYQIGLQQAVAALLKACNYVQLNNYNIEGEEKKAVLEGTLKPFLDLSDQDQKRLSGLKVVGQKGAGYCFNSYIQTGNKLESFKNALINNVGGWQLSQFGQ